LEEGEAKSAVNESVRRIRTIALVHETLSREPGEDVAFIEIVRPLLRLVEESLQSPDRPIRFVVHGDGGRLPATIATPLSVVLTELLQNAVDHGFKESNSHRGGNVSVHLSQEVEVSPQGEESTRLCVRVLDDGAGLDPNFDISQATGLGLSIVRTLVSTELGGTIDMRSATAADYEEADVELPSNSMGTMIELVVPIAAI
jgi:two-component sensor histidine kinase